MESSAAFDWRQYDRKLFAWAAFLFTAIVLIGFGRTYYIKFATDAPPLPSLLVHIHGLLMTAWVAFFVVQVWLVRSRNAKLHMKLGIFGIALAVLLILVNFFTAVAAAKFGSNSTPPDIPRLTFLAVPISDILLFVLFFAGAIFYRKNPPNHKRLMLLTAVNFLPPALSRIPLEIVPKLGPLVFFGIPAVITLGLIIFDTWRNRKLNLPFLIGSLVLIVSFPLRMMIGFTEPWVRFADWLTTWAA